MWPDPDKAMLAVMLLKSRNSSVCCFRLQDEMYVEMVCGGDCFSALETSGAYR